MINKYRRQRLYLYNSLCSHDDVACHDDRTLNKLLCRIREGGVHNYCIIGGMAVHMGVSPLRATKVRVTAHIIKYLSLTSRRTLMWT